MATKNKSNNKIILDPGNVLFILYVGFVLIFTFLAMAVDGAAVLPADVQQKEVSLFPLLDDSALSMPAAELSGHLFSP